MLLQVYSALARDGSGHRPKGGNTMSNDYATGLAIGIIAALIIFAVMWIVIVCNAVSAFSGLRTGAMVNGKLAFGPFASLIFVIALIIIMVALKIRSRNAALEEAEEDE